MYGYIYLHILTHREYTHMQLYTNQLKLLTDLELIFLTSFLSFSLDIRICFVSIVLTLIASSDNKVDHFMSTCSYSIKK